MRLFLIASIALGVTLPVAAQSPLPKDGACPSGFYSSGKYCVPIKDESRPAMMRAGQCPTGYRTSGKYCVAMSKSAREAISKNGACPPGYFSSGSYCLKNKSER